MHNLNDLLNKAMDGTGQQGPQMRHSEPPTMEFLKAILQELTRMNLLNSVSAEVYKTWARGLSDLSEKEIKRGLLKARDFKGYFSLPSFREICKSIDLHDYGLPDERRAYEEACLKPSPKDRQQWSHAAVYHAGRLTGWHELHAMETEKIFPRYAYNYRMLCDRIAAGENINIDVPQAIPEKISRTLTVEENLERMNKLKQQFGW
jgi:hypothetical protein